MSADLVLLSAPVDEEWLRRWTFLQRANVFIDSVDEDDENFYQDADGYWRSKLADERMEKNGYGPLLHVTWGEQHRLERELRTRGDDTLPHQWIGQVSWLKAGLMDDRDTWVPSAVMRVSEAVESCPVLTPGLASDIMATMNLPNRSAYGKRQVRVIKAENGVYCSRSTKALGGHMYLMKKPRRDDTYSGLVRRQTLRRWLDAQMGRRLVSESW